MGSRFFILNFCKKWNFIFRAFQALQCFIYILKSLEISLISAVKNPLVLRAQKSLEKRDSDLASLLEELENCVPYHREDYDACLALFKRSNPSSSELSFLKKQLKLRKLQSNGALPNNLFTVSHQGRALSLTAIRDKFFALFNEE